jgi:hypothetical protein
MISAVSLTPPKSRWCKVKNCIGTSSTEFCCRISAVSITPLKRFQQCHWYRWNDFRGVIDIAETISAVSLTPLKWFPRCHWHCEMISAASLTPLKWFQRYQWHWWNHFRGVNDTAEINVTPRNLKQTWQVLFLPLKGKSSKNISMAHILIPVLYKYKQKKVGGCLDLIFCFSGVNDTAETDFGDFWSDYLGEYHAICKTGLAC